MSTNWIPVYGTGFSVGCSGSTESIEARVMAANGLAAATYCGVLYREVLVPGGTAAQPYLAATSWSYCFEVAQETNFHAAPALLVPCGTPSAHVHSHPEDLVRSTGARAYPVCA
jgi:hypothetical protein